MEKIKTYDELKAEVKGEDQDPGKAGDKDPDLTGSASKKTRKTKAKTGTSKNKGSEK